LHCTSKTGGFEDLFWQVWKRDHVRLVEKYQVALEFSDARKRAVFSSRFQTTFAVVTTPFS
jgi:hypothetical protein